MNAYDEVDTIGEFSGVARRTHSFTCGSFGCIVRMDGPTRATKLAAYALLDRVNATLAFSGLSIEEFLLLAEFCQLFDVMALDQAALDSAIAKVLPDTEKGK